MVRVRSLSQEEAAALEQVVNTARDAQVLRRALMVWFSHLGKRVSEISQLLIRERQAVIRAIRRYEEQGLEGLRDNPRSGRPQQVPASAADELKELAVKSPRLLGYEQNNWTLALLQRELARRWQITLSHEHVRRLLLRAGFCFRRPKLHLVSPDPEYDQKRGLWKRSS